MDNVILFLKKNGELHLDILVDINLDFIVMCSGNLGSWLPKWNTNANTEPPPPGVEPVIQLWFQHSNLQWGHMNIFFNWKLLQYYQKWNVAKIKDFQ